MPFLPEAAILPIMMISTLASTGVAAAGAMEQASATQNQMNFQAQVAKFNQQMDIDQANRERMLGEQQAQQQGMKTRAEVGSIMATQGAAGLDVTSGSPLAVQQSAQKLGQYNEALVRNDASRRAYDYLVKGFADEASQNLYTFGAQQAPIAGGLKAGGTVLAGIGSVSEQYARFGPASTLGA
jgi:hypothetical protein